MRSLNYKVLYCIVTLDVVRDVKRVHVLHSLFEIVTVLLQSSLLFADGQQLRLSLFEPGRQFIYDLQRTTCIYNSSRTPVFQAVFLCYETENGQYIREQTMQNIFPSDIFREQVLKKAVT